MRRNHCHTCSFAKYLLPLLTLTLSIGVNAQVTSIKPAKDNFTYFTPEKSYGNIEKLTALTSQNRYDSSKSVIINQLWNEQINKRTLKSRTYIDDNGKSITQYSYNNINYVDKNGRLNVVDTRLKQTGNGWAVTQQENPAYLYTDAGTALSIGNGQLITFNKNVQFNSTAINTTTFTVGDNGMMIKNVVPNTDKMIRFKRNMIETDYLINQPLKISGDLIISEDIILPAGYNLITDDGATNETEEGSLIVVAPDGKQKAILKVPACYDKGKSEVLGSYQVKRQDGGYRLEIDVPSVWINNPSRQYPVTVDPVVTGTTTYWTGGKIASCIYPNFGSGTMRATVPSDITITGFYIQSSYYANPLVSEPLDDGLIYFGTKCGATGFSSINAPVGDSSGVGTFPLTDFHSSLACCIHPSCDTQTIDLTMYLSRLAGGNTCDSQYIYYDPANTGGCDFEAYIVGNTVELNNSIWSVSPTLLCSNDCTLTLDATINYGVPPYTITHPWAGSSVTIGRYDTSICSSTGTAQITLTIPNCPLTSCTTTLLSVPPPVITDACGTVIKGLTSKFISVKPAPTVTVFPDSQKVCSGSPFSISLISCVSGTTFSWVGSDNSKGTGSPIVDSIPDSSGKAHVISYTIIPSTDSCTGKPVTINVTVEPIPTSRFIVGPGCVNERATVVYTGTVIPGANYNWNFGGATIISGSGGGPYTILFPSSGKLIISLMVTANGCTSDLTSDTITLKPDPVITAGPNPVTICSGKSTVLTASGANTYNWSPTTSFNSPSGSSVIITSTTDTTYTVIGVDTNGCTDTVNIAVLVNPLPHITATPTIAKICYTDSVDLTAKGGQTYAWSPSLGLKETSGSSIIAAPSDSTKYIVIGTDTNGCSDTASVLIAVIPGPPLTVNPVNPEICSGGSVVLLASGALTYIWYPSPGLSCTNCSNPIASPTATSTYIVRSMNTTCPGFDTVTLKVDTMPTLSISKDTLLCQTKPIQLIATTDGSISWSPSTGLSCSTCDNPIVTPDTTITYKAVAKNGACSVSDSVTISVNIFKFNASPPYQRISYGNTVQLYASGAEHYSWTPSGSLSNDTITDPVASPTITTTYYVTGTNALGCTSVDTVIIYVNDPCEVSRVPSAFTPDGDDRNNYLHVIDYGGITLNDFRVFNRWGQLLYETNNINDRGWDGTFNGKPQPIGTYVYYAEIVCEDRIIYLRGNATLIR